MKQHNQTRKNNYTSNISVIIYDVQRVKNI